MVIDAWMQHPGQSWLDNELFDSLRRWKPGPWSQSAQPIEKTLSPRKRAVPIRCTVAAGVCGLEADAAQGGAILGFFPQRLPVVPMPRSRTPGAPTACAPKS
jgi:hypothetical protein